MASYRFFKFDKKVWGWVFYDWANSAFATTVMAGFFPIFFKQYWSAGVDVTVSTARLGFSNSLASLLVAMLAPFLGAVADLGSARKKFLIFFTYLAVLMTTALFFVGKGGWQWAALIYSIGILGFSGAQIFYDALLPVVARRDRYDFISSLGYSMGYLGGGILFSVNVAMTLWPEHFGIPDTAFAVRISFLTVALWWFCFSALTFIWVDEKRSPGSCVSLENLVNAVGKIFQTIGKVKQHRNIFLFLLAYWFYIDGVDTIIRMAVDYGLSLGFHSNNLIVALLIVQFVGFPAAVCFGKLGEKWGGRKAIYLAIVCYMMVTLWGAFMTRQWEFYVLAIAIGMVQGGIQTLSRSYYACLIPDGQEAEFFGFYNMLGRFAAIVGPALMAIVGLSLKHVLLPTAPTVEQVEAVGQLAARWGIVSILLLFLAGAFFFSLVQDPEKDY